MACVLVLLRWLPLIGVLLSVACHPASVGDTPAPRVEPPPEAEVVARLGPAGPPPSQLGVPATVAPGVVAVGPSGSTGVYPTLFVRFTEPMLGATKGAAAPTFEVDPPVDGGHMTWVSPYRAVFNFNKRLPLATAFKVQVTGALVTATGAPLALDAAFEFETERPEVTVATLERVWDDEESRHWKTKFSVSSPSPLRVRTLRKHLHAVARRVDGSGAAQRVPVDLRLATTREVEDHYWLEPGAVIVRPRAGHWPPDREIELVVEKTLRLGGPLPIGRAVSAAFVTEPGLRVKFECALRYEDGCDPGPVRVRFSRQVSKAQIKRIRVSPRPARLTRNFTYADKTGDVVQINGRFEAGKTYTFTIDERVRDIYGQPSPAPIREEVVFVQPPPRVSLLGSHGTLPAKHKRTVGLETRWVERVRIRAAVLKDTELVSQFLRDNDDLRIPSDARGVHDKTIDLKVEGALGWASHAIDISAIAEGERRPVLIEVTPVSMMSEAAGRPQPKVQRAIYQQSDLGAVALVSPARSVARVSALESAKPVSGLDVDLYRGTKTIPAPLVTKLGKVGTDGLVEFPRSTTLPKRGLLLVHGEDDRVVARVGELAQRRRSHSWYDDPYSDPERLLSQVVTERPLYRPGDEVYVVGWSAVSTNHTHVGLRALPKGTPVLLQLVDANDETVAERTVATKASGKYWANLKVPDTGALGYYRIRATIQGEEFSTGVRVKDFRVPTFQVKVSADRGDLVPGESIDVALAASYYFGGAVPIERLTRRVSCTRRRYRPPNIKRRWRLGQLDRRAAPYRVQGDSGALVLSADDAAAGRTHITAGTGTLTGIAPYRCVMSLAARDISMQDVGAEQTWWVHPEVYVAAAKPEKSVRAGDRWAVSARTFDHSGVRLAEPVLIKLVHHKWMEVDGEWKTEPQPPRTCAVTTTKQGPDAECVVPRARRGRYTFEVVRAAGPEPRAVAEGSLWVGRKVKARRTGARPRFSLEVSPPDPKPGEKIVLQLSAPYATGDGVIALAHGGVRRLEPFSLVDGKATVEVKTDQAWVPRLRVDAIVPVAAARGRRPRLDRDSASVGMDGHGRDLTVTVKAPPIAGPNEEIEIGLEVRGADGTPTAANVSVWAVDEAVLSLAEPIIPDLARAFIVDRRPRTAIHDTFGAILYPYSVRSDPYVVGWELQGLGLGGMGAGGGGSGEGFGSGKGAAAHAPARERFETTPIFIGDVAIPATGVGSVRGTLPENLTTFRITAIASASLPKSKATGRFGHGEARTRLTIPLALRVVAPRVMRPGDTAEFAAVVDNLGGPDGTIEVTMNLGASDGVLVPRGVQRRSVPIVAGGQVRLPFSVAAEAVGSGTVQMRVQLKPNDGGAPLHDAMKIEVPVQRERTLVRRSATYGSLDSDGAVAVAVDTPADVTPGTGAVSVRLNTSLVDGLQDVAANLVDYPYGCVEQTSSGLVPLVALGELARSYPLGIEDVHRYLAAGVARLRSMQTDSGGLAYWPGARNPHLYGTAYALWVLQQVRSAGYPVSVRLTERMEAYLRGEISRWAKRDGSSPHHDVPIAMALHALSLGGGLPEEAVDKLVGLEAGLPAFATALTAMALHHSDPTDGRIDELIAVLAAQLETAGGGATVRASGPTFTQYFDSAPRTQAMVLLALSTVRPKHPAIEPVARGLVGLRQAGRIRNTQENAYTLLALAGYAREFETATPDLMLDAWMGEQHVVSRRIAAERFVSERGEAPMAGGSSSRGPTRVTVRREGEGRVYYRVAMAWTPQNEQERAVAAGIAVDTVLRSADGPVDEHTEIVPGTLLALDVTVTVDAALSYAAVDIPLPAGLEAVDTSFGKGRKAMVLSGKRGWWASHEEVRSDRALLFADRLGPGAHTHTVFLRATTPGTFEMPPTVAQSMYFPEIAGHTARRRVVVGSLP